MLDLDCLRYNSESDPDPIHCGSGSVAWLDNCKTMRWLELLKSGFRRSDNVPFPSSCWPMGALTTVTLLAFCGPCHAGGVATSKGSDMVAWSPVSSKNPAPACLAINLKNTSKMVGGRGRPVASAFKSSMLTPRAAALSEHRGSNWSNSAHDVSIPFLIRSICSGSRLSMLPGQDALPDAGLESLSVDPTWSLTSFQIWDGLIFGV